MADGQIKAIIFDVGGVLIRTEDLIPRMLLDKRHDLKPGGSEILVFNGEMGRKAQLGEITSDELYAWIGDHLGLDAEKLSHFRSDFWAGDFLDESLVDLARQLKKEYTVCIISNYMDALPEMLKTEYPAADAFHFMVVSAHVGVMKPDRKIFEHTLRLLNLEPQETVFIDDFMHNIDGCRAVGMHGIHFQPDTDLAAELRKLGVQI